MTLDTSLVQHEPVRPMARRRALRSLAVVGFGGALLALVACTPKTEVTVASPQQQTGIAVTGQATVNVKPDVARLNLGVQVTEPTVAAARNNAADAMTKLQAALKAKGVQEKDIRTQALNINPQYANQPNGGTPRITGYQVANTVQVTVRNLDTVSEVIDAAVAAGGNAVRMNGISFTATSRSSSSRGRARRQ